MENRESLVRSGVSSNHASKIETFLLNFDQHWTESSLTKFVQRISTGNAELKKVTIQELVKIDLERRWAAGKRVRLESYLKSYPILGTPKSASAELIICEYFARIHANEPQTLEQFSDRFPNQASELARLVDQSDSTHHQTQAERRTHPKQGSSTLNGQPLGQAQALPERLGKYQIVKQIGEGGMGAVYLAEDTKLHRKVALKIPHPHVLADPEILVRFETEARAAAALNHPNICAIHDVDQIDGFHFLAMEFIEGRDLTKLVKPGLTQGDTVTYVQKLAVALQEAHDRNVIHRDLKPSNIRVNERDEPIIMDFGLARVTQEGVSTHTRTGLVMGTPMYMAPEQAKGETTKMGPASDIYSLGAVMYELLCGRPPFEGEFMSVLAKILTEEPEPLTNRCTSDPELQRICKKAMAKEVENRYASMSMFAADLEQYIANTDVESLQRKPNRKRGTPSVIVDSRIPKSELETQGQTSFRTRFTKPKRSNRFRWGIPIAVVSCILIASILIPLSRPKFGSILLSIDEPTANVEISLNGEPIAISSLSSAQKLRVGTNQLKVVGSNYKTINKTLDINSGENRPYEIRLTKTVGEVVINFVEQVKNPIVMIDGKAIDEKQLELPIVLSPGKHELRVTSNGYLPYENSFSIFQGKSYSLPILLKPEQVEPPVTDDLKLANRTESSQKENEDDASDRELERGRRDEGVNADESSERQIVREDLEGEEPKSQDPILVSLKKPRSFYALDDQEIFKTVDTSSLQLEVLGVDKLGAIASIANELNTKEFDGDVIIQFDELKGAQLRVKLTNEKGIVGISIYSQYRMGKVPVSINALEFEERIKKTKKMIQENVDKVNNLKTLHANLQKEYDSVSATQPQIGSRQDMAKRDALARLQTRLKKCAGEHDTNLFKTIPRQRDQVEEYKQILRIANAVDEEGEIHFRILALSNGKEVELLRTR